MKTHTWHIHIEGQVQGVGFRPFVYKTARSFNLTGWVNNSLDGVHTEFNADSETAQKFYRALLDNAPALSVITRHQMQEATPIEFDRFKIVHSNFRGKAKLLLSPDFGLCENCRHELFAADDRRFRYPFITCTHCGPRYSIIKQLPYDRETTTMSKFTMCPDCYNEYWDPLNRRYYSQTNSCSRCGIELSFFDADGKLLNNKTGQIIELVPELWAEGKIVAIKGIGGYLLTCDAGNQTAIQRLRNRKQRPTKPFALMYPDLESIERDLVLSVLEKKLLLSTPSPILLLPLKETAARTLCLDEIAPGLSQLGVMIPYTPLYALLMQSFGKPIIATSGNISNSPIVFTDEKALEELTHIADYILTNNRRIVVPQDDSVLAFTPVRQQKITIRRSRGFAPTYLNTSLELPNKTMLATGAMLKSTFTYLHQQNLYISQFLGDLSHFDTEQHFKNTVDHFIKLFGQSPEIVLADQHPDYFSTRFAEQVAEEQNIPLKKYQHHIAHFAAVLGEHNLIDSTEPVLGVIWDGIGLGEDNQVWGGEFFTYRDYTFNRYAHFDYFDYILGDKMSREPRLSALAAAINIDGAKVLLRKKFNRIEWANYRTLLARDNNLKTSSVGRLFDAVASLLDLKNRSQYEGEAPMLLEALARQYTTKNGLDIPQIYPGDSEGANISTTMLLGGVIRDLRKGIAKNIIAAKFHDSLARLICEVAETANIQTIAFSGGVFQNSLLVDFILHQANESHQLYFHRDLPPNDENISFGQLVCHLIDLKNSEATKASAKSQDKGQEIDHS